MAEGINEATKTLKNVVPPIILAIGTVGNILSFLVLTRPKAKQFSTAVYLVALSVVDFIAFYTGLLRILVAGFFEVNVRRVSAVSCWVHIFLVYFSINCSSWLVCAVTLE